MKFAELGGSARSRAIDAAWEAWMESDAGQATWRKIEEHGMRRFLQATGFDQWADVVGFELGDSVSHGSGELTLSLKWLPGAAWQDDGRRQAMVDALSGNDWCGSWLGDARGDAGASAESCGAAMDAIAREAPFEFFDVGNMDGHAYDALTDQLASGELDYEFDEDGNLVG